MSARSRGLLVALAFLVPVFAVSVAGAEPEYPPSGAAYGDVDTRFFHHWIGSEDDARRFVRPGDGSVLWVGVFADSAREVGADEIRVEARVQSSRLEFARTVASGVARVPQQDPARPFVFLELPFEPAGYGLARYELEIEVFVVRDGAESSVGTATVEGEVWVTPVPAWTFVLVAVLAVLAIPAIGIAAKRRREAKPPKPL